MHTPRQVFFHTGAFSTGTHGTGVKLGALATQLVALRIMDASGVLHIANATTHGDLFSAAQVGIGAIGTAVSQLIPAVLHEYSF